MGMISAPNEQLRRIVLSGSIRESIGAEFLEQITALECADISRPITIYIDTYGGSVDTALLMYDAIKTCCCPIVTVGIGKVMSAGTLLLASGEHGSRFITEHTRVMIHEVSAGTWGSMTEMETAVDEIKRLQEVYVDILSKDTGIGKKQLLQDMKATRYMTAPEAIKYGIVDKVVPTRNKNKKNIEKVAKKKTTKKKK
jgi:ATP-dependent Clp protease protease subunit